MVKMKNHRDLVTEINTASNRGLEELIRLSIGRILKLGSRPEQTGDFDEYEKYRWLVMSSSEELKNREQGII
jgi:hypothetical protein